VSFLVILVVKKKPPQGSQGRTQGSLGYSIQLAGSKLNIEIEC